MLDLEKIECSMFSEEAFTNLPLETAIEKDFDEWSTLRTRLR